MRNITLKFNYLAKQLLKITTAVENSFMYYTSFIQNYNFE